MAHQRPRGDRQRPRTFRPPPPRRPKRQRAPLGWAAPGFRARIVPSVARAFCAVAFAGYSAFEARFGDAALVVASLGLASFMAAIVYVSVKMQSEFNVVVLLPDVVALAVLPSILWIASGIKVADARFGGNAGHFMLAALAVLAFAGIVMALAAVLNVSEPERASLAALGGCFTVVAVLGAGNRFASGSLPDGMSLAWMGAAALTLADGIVPQRSRAAVRLAGVGGFVALMAITGISGGGRGGGNATNNVIALLVTLTISGVVLGLPGWTARLRSNVIDDAVSIDRNAARVPQVRYPGGDRRI